MSEAGAICEIRFEDTSAHSLYSCHGGRCSRAMGKVVVGGVGAHFLVYALSAAHHVIFNVRTV